RVKKLTGLRVQKVNGLRVQKVTRHHTYHLEEEEFVSKKISRKLLAASVTLSLALSGTAVAAAQPTQSRAATVSTAQTPATSPSINTSPAPSTAPSTVEEQGKITAIIKAGMKALKKINKSWYDKIISKAREGKATFVAWWDASVPGWIKTLMGGVTSSAIWEFISTYLL
ncbi:hypothetical protein, partial [Corynebacterium sp. KPL2838]|uniref:hypothetical protein n=1 Tax=Corynebacterium sp. KPL2838 TaxID=3158316 RepID=UPI0032EC00DB